MAKQHKYTKEQDEFIKNNYTNVSECVSKFNKRFGTNLSYSALKSHANRTLKITTGFRPWTAEMDDAIEKLIWKHPYRKATDKFNEQYGTEFTVKQIQDHCVRKGMSRKYFDKLEEVDNIIKQNIDEKNYAEIRKKVNKKFGMKYTNDTTICVRANNLGLSRPHRTWQNNTDRRFINGEEVTYSEYVRFIGHRFHRLEKELQPIARQIVKLQYEVSNK